LTHSIDNRGDFTRTRVEELRLVRLGEAVSALREGRLESICARAFNRRNESVRGEDDLCRIGKYITSLRTVIDPREALLTYGARSGCSREVGLVGAGGERRRRVGKDGG